MKGETGDQGVQGPLGPTGPLGPKGARGYRGYRGYKGDQGQAGQPGPRGSLILKHLITGKSWQEAAARNAITAEAARPPLVGDIVTLTNPEAGYHETRRYDGADFSTSADILSGDALIAGTVAARHLSLDGTSLTAHPHTGMLQVAAISADQITQAVFFALPITSQHNQALRLRPLVMPNLMRCICAGVLLPQRLKPLIFMRPLLRWRPLLVAAFALISCRALSALV